jgi:hypothetical protein
LPTANGGTGLTSFTANGVVYASSTSALATGSALTFDGTTTTTPRLAFGGTTLPAAGTATIFGRSSDNNLYLQSGSGNGINFLDGSQNTMLTLAPTNLVFQISNAEQMRLTSTGLGIGTSSPNRQLELSTFIAGAPTGTGFVGGALRLSNLTDYESNYGINPANPDFLGSIEFYSGDGSAGTGVRTAIKTSVEAYYNDNSLCFYTAPAATAGILERMRIQANGNVGIGTNTPISTQSGLDISSGGLSLIIGADNGSSTRTNAGNKSGRFAMAHYTNAEEPFAIALCDVTSTTNELSLGGGSGACNTATVVKFFTAANNTTVSGSERARIDSSGNLFVAKTTQDTATVGIELLSDGRGNFTVSSNEVVNIKRLASDGNLIRFFQDATEEGNISVSGTTVSYNGGHLSRWAQTTAPKDNTLVKGTVLSNLDAMNVYTNAEGNPVDNEQLNKVKVSDTEGDANVAGVFVNWSHDEDHNVDEINMAMTGDMIIRIAQGVTVVRGDLLMSAGDGTAKPQGDDIVRSKTVAKVTSNHITCTYADGSYCVPCVLMAC